MTLTHTLLAGVVGIIIGNLMQIYLAHRKEKLQLAMVALDKRLDAYQEAFYHWHRVFAALPYPDDLPGVVEEASEWLPKNRLYLDTEVSKEFSRCLNHARNYPERLKELQQAFNRERDVAAFEKQMEQNISQIAGTGDAIRKAVYRLPPVVSLNI